MRLGIHIRTLSLCSLHSESYALRSKHQTLDSMLIAVPPLSGNSAKRSLPKSPSSFKKVDDAVRLVAAG